MSDTLLDQADALMRRRTFVAGARSEANEPALAAADADAEDVPILTEVVDIADTSAYGDTASGPVIEYAANWKVEKLVRQRIDALLSERSAELAHEIETWLDEQMPQLVIRAMDGITDHLVALLANRARDDLLPRLENVMQLSDGAQAEADDSE